LPFCLAIDDKPATRQVQAYRSKHGPLELDGAPVALAAVRSSGRTLPELDEPAILERVRAHLEPQLSLDEFIRTSVARGGGRFHDWGPYRNQKGGNDAGRCV
jgi:hypothetical protein